MTDFLTSTELLCFVVGAIVVGSAWLLVESQQVRKKMVRDIEQHRLRKILMQYNIDPVYYGEVTLTWRSNELVVITVQDDDSRILKVLWEKTGG